MSTEVQNTTSSQHDAKLLVRRSALSWWSRLSKSKQSEYENRFFGVSPFWEDGELSEADIIRLFQRFAQRLAALCRPLRNF